MMPAVLIGDMTSESFLFYGEIVLPVNTSNHIISHSDLQRMQIQVFEKDFGKIPFHCFTKSAKKYKIQLVFCFLIRI